MGEVGTPTSIFYSESLALIEAQKKLGVNLFQARLLEHKLSSLDKQALSKAAQAAWFAPSQFTIRDMTSVSVAGITVYLCVMTAKCELMIEQVAAQINELSGVLNNRPVKYEGWVCEPIVKPVEPVKVVEREVVRYSNPRHEEKPKPAPVPEKTCLFSKAASWASEMTEEGFWRHIDLIDKIELNEGNNKAALAPLIEALNDVSEEALENFNNFLNSAFYLLRTEDFAEKSGLPLKQPHFNNVIANVIAKGEVFYRKVLANPALVVECQPEFGELKDAIQQLRDPYEMTEDEFWQHIESIDRVELEKGNNEAALKPLFAGLADLSALRQNNFYGHLGKVSSRVWDNKDFFEKTGITKKGNSFQNIIAYIVAQGRPFYEKVLADFSCVPGHHPEFVELILESRRLKNEAQIQLKEIAKEKEKERRSRLNLPAKEEE